MTHGDNHWVVWIEVFWIELMVIWFNHGATCVTILLLHLVEFILHYLLAELRIVQNLVQVVDGLHQLIEFIVQLLQTQACQLAEAHIHDVSGMGLGEHTAAAQFQLGDAYKMLSAPAVTVRVSEHGSSSAQTTESTESDRGDTGSQSSSNRESGASSAKENVDAESGNAA